MRSWLKLRRPRSTARYLLPAAFLAHARDGETNKIFYEDYVAFLKGQQALRKL